MSAPDPEGMNLLAKVLWAAAALLGPPLLFWKWLNGQFALKADKDAVSKAFHEVKNEIAIHRGYFKDVFNEMKAMEQRAHDRHVELIDKIHEARGKR